MLPEQEACLSILRGIRDGEPWNHLCILPANHTEEHQCWHGPSCAVWDDAEASGRAPHMRSRAGTTFTRSKEKAA